MKKAIATIILTLGLSYPVYAQGVNCEYQPIPSQIAGKSDTYTASTTEATYLQTLPLTGRYKGRTVQSVGIDPSTCRTIATISAKQKPEVVGIWSLLPNGREQGKFMLTEEFGHPQNLSIEHDGTNNPYMWLPDSEGLGAKRFKLVKDKNGDLALRSVQFYRLLDNPVASHTVAISADNKYIGIMGLISDEYYNKQTVKIFLLQDVLNNRGRLRPVSEFQLAPEQQPRGEYRQGLAIVGSTVFVLTGKPSISSPNRIVSYTFRGSKIQSDVLNAGVNEGYDHGNGEFLEPEGLSVIYQKNKLWLVVNLVSGDAGKKYNELYKIPLYSGNMNNPYSPPKDKKKELKKELKDIILRKVEKEIFKN